MSIELPLRDGALQAKRNEIAQLARSHRAKLRSLNLITATVAKQAALSGIHIDFHALTSPPPLTTGETAFLDANSLLHGRFFQDSTLQYPYTSTQDVLQPSISTSKPNSVPTEPYRSVSPAPTPAGTDANAIEASVDDGAVDMATANEQQPSSLQHDIGFASASHDFAPLLGAQAQDSPSAVPSSIAPPQPDEEAQMDTATDELLNLQSQPRPAKVVHLSPQREQEERFHAVEHDFEEARRKSDSEPEIRSRLAPSALQTEIVSSPGSTLWSATTPMPAQESSPDTSPDSEHQQVEVPPPKDLQPSPEEQRAKEEHDRLLEAQKEAAHRDALGDIATPDEQLRLEEQQAVAARREELEAQAHQDDETAVQDTRPELDERLAVEPTKAEETVNETQKAIEPAQLHHAKDKTPEDTPREAMPPPVSTLRIIDDSKSLQKSPVDDYDGDNITVTPRTIPSKPPSVRRQPSHSEAAPDRMTTRVSSGAMRQKSVSEIIGETPKPSPRIQREPSMDELVSPMTVRHPQDFPVPSVPALETPHRRQRSSLLQTPSRNTASLMSLTGEYAALRGVADDPAKDYLEPLFRIQAYEPGDHHTAGQPLHNLLRSATKVVSTQDQLATIHERQDFRILRRIYHLQNANKWSLRQMERCKEPEQPRRHWDYMMAEMKWMRKDFKEERKVKRAQCRLMALACVEYVTASPEDKAGMRVKVVSPRSQILAEQEPREDCQQLAVKAETAESGENAPPEFLASAPDDSGPEDEAVPGTPKDYEALPASLVVPAELSGAVVALQRAGKLSEALGKLPVLDRFESPPAKQPMPTVSKFCEGKVLAKILAPSRKRSRFDYEDEARILEYAPAAKRLQKERELPPEQGDIALFHPENKHIRDRLHANNAFRPPSEFPMPSTSFYEYRAGSQWIWDDEQKLRRLAKEYSFNWSLIADEMALPSNLKSSADRRTPWECFERWVELETLPAEMRKTLYFKTWGQRLDLATQAVDRRYQAQVAAAQAQNAPHTPIRRRTTPVRVEKRKNSRYLHWMDVMRKLARKREQQAYKQQEAARSAVQRKQHQETNQPRQNMMTPQQFSQKRYERDCQFAEAQRVHRQRLQEAQRAQLAMRASQAAGQQQGLPIGGSAQQRPGSSSAGAPNGMQVQANGLPQQAMNGQVPTSRQSLPMATRNGHLAVPQMHAQGIPQAQMHPNMRAPANINHPLSAQDMQRMAQLQAQARGTQFSSQQFAAPNPSMVSPGGMTNSQQLAQNQALLAQMQNGASNAMNNHRVTQSSSGHGLQNNQQMSASPQMPPPPTPAQPQQLSSGHIPAVVAIKTKLRGQFPGASDDELQHMVNIQLKQQNSQQVMRQNAMNTAAGIGGGQAMSSNPGLGTYGHNQVAFQNNATLPNGTPPYVNGDGSNSQAGMNGANTSPTANYAQIMQRRQLQQMQQMQRQSPNATHASLHGSPAMTHASPNTTPVSPSMQYSTMNMAGVNGMANGTNGQRPPSRSNTPQMQ